MEQRALPPVLVLISDGQPTDDFEAGLAALMAEPWARKAVRLAIAMGHDADEEVLQRFIGPGTGLALPRGEVPGASGEMPRHPVGRSPRRPLQASNATTLARYIQWASTAVVGAASTSASRIGGGEEEGQNVPLPELPPTELDPIDEPDPLKW
jgi:hypothetical protein